MNVPIFIARKYFLSGKRKAFVNFIVFISIGMLVVGTMLLVLLLSVFNGFSDQLRQVHQAFDPEIVIVPSAGKSFPISDSLRSAITQVAGVQVLTEVIEDDVYLTYDGKQRIARFKGVTANFTAQNGIENAIIHGSSELSKQVTTDPAGSYKHTIHYAIVGMGLKYDMDMALSNQFIPIQLYYPKRGKIIRTEKSLNRIPVQPGGVFEIERQYDDNYLFIPMETAEQLTDYQGIRTALEIKTMEKSRIDEVKAALQSALGSEFKVLAGDEQHESLYRAIQIEKLVAYLVFILVLLIACLNLYIAISMMVVSKQKDIAVLQAMGAPQSVIRKIFLVESLFIGTLGTGLGLFLGWLICYLQQNFDLVPLGAESALLQAFPIKMMWTDFFMTGVTILLMAFLISMRPIIRATQVDIKTQL